MKHQISQVMQIAEFDDFELASSHSKKLYYLSILATLTAALIFGYFEWQS